MADNHDALPELREGQVAARIDYIRDPGMTGWITNKALYAAGAPGQRYASLRCWRNN